MGAPFADMLECQRSEQYPAFGAAPGRTVRLQHRASPRSNARHTTRHCRWRPRSRGGGRIEITSAPRVALSSTVLTTATDNPSPFARNLA